jgi:D-amino peptidase
MEVKESEPMKIYISADMEGVTGVTHWDEVERLKTDYAEFREQMTSEVAAACEGAMRAGAAEIWIKDAHASGRNLIASRLPKQTRLIRGWSGHPFSMVQELDDSFSALVMIGYHSRAGSNGNPLAHTNSGKIARVTLNGREASELQIHAYAAAYVGVSLVFVSGDEGICAEAEQLIPGIRTLSVKRGTGSACINIHPQLAVEKINAGVQHALQDDTARDRLVLPGHFKVEISYRDHTIARKASFFPGAVLKRPHVIEFESPDYFEVMRLFSFVL